MTLEKQPAAAAKSRIPGEDAGKVNSRFRRNRSVRRA
jgi:hypothetical protein